MRSTKRKPFKYTGKRKNPKTYVDVNIDSDRFDKEPDRIIIIVWAGELVAKPLVYGLTFPDVLIEEVCC